MPIMLLSFADQALVPKTTLIETNLSVVDASFHWFLGSRKEFVLMIFKITYEYHDAESRALYIP